MIKYDIRPNDGRDYQLDMNGQWYSVSGQEFNDEDLNFGEKGQAGIFEDQPEEETNCE